MCDAGSSEHVPFNSKTKCPEQFEELLGLIEKSLRALDGADPPDCSVPRRRPQSTQMIALVLDKAPKHRQTDLVTLVPRLVEHLEHPLAACALLDRFQKPNTVPALQLPIFCALNQLECSSGVWERILSHSFELLTDSNDEPLLAIVDFIFKAALHCEHPSEAVRSVLTRLKTSGVKVFTCVLDYLSRMINSCADVAEAIPRDIDCDDDVGDDHSTMCCGIFLLGETGSSSETLKAVDEQTFHTTLQFSDIYMLIEMLSISCHVIEASQTFERAIARGLIMAQYISMVLERSLAWRLNLTSQLVAESLQQLEVVGEATEQLRAQEGNFNLVLALAETLALSRDFRVREFVKILYTILFRWYADESFRLKILNKFVDRATSTADSSPKVDLDLEILMVLVYEEQDVVRPVLSMIREVKRTALWHQLCASEHEILHVREEKKDELSCMIKEKAVLSQRLSESKATNNCLESDMRAQVDRFAQEKNELSKQVQEVEYQLEWLWSERDDEFGKLTTEKKYNHFMSIVQTVTSKMRSLQLDGQPITCYFQHKVFPKVPFFFMSNDEAYFNLAIENRNSQNVIVAAKEVDKKFRAVIKQYERNNP